ncbi:type VII secretion protein EsaA [Streptococcus plurextorum]|uniref:type VII secretion protein EsaA n=1 Tax=Streptococcus plurextorum TaxID=456876 RepID=UPI00048984F3|nr:type VII secretion protein EsaA [Streptococcus plurextorum]
MNRKVLISLGGLLLVVTVLFSFFAIIKPTPITPTATQTPIQSDSIKIAVVNEDTGMLYNGEQYNMASTLLASFAKNSNYNIEVVTRAIAERGIENDTYQLMIVLPSKFSEETLALESINPVKANFQYQIKADKQLTIKQAEQAVVDFKSLFNKDLINVYFSSIIGNLHTAQLQVSDVVSKESQVLNAFNTSLADPLSLYSQQFTGIGSSPDSLLSAYSVFNKDLLNSNEAFTSIIDVDKTYEATIEQVKGQQDAWQQSIDNREKALADYDDSLSKMTVEDQLTRLSELNTYLTKDLSEPVVWKETTEKAEAYNVVIEALLEKLNQLNTEIDTTLSDYDVKIKEAVSASLANNSQALSGTTQTLGNYVKSLNESMASQIKLKWPSKYFEDSTIDNLSLSAEDRRHLKNVSSFMEWYHKANHLELPEASILTLEQEQLNALKEKIKEAIEKPRTLKLPSFEGEFESLTLKVPNGVTLISASGFTVGAKDRDGYQQLQPNATVSSGTTLTYQLAVDNDNDLSVFSPVTVLATIHTNESVEFLTGETPETSVSSSISESSNMETTAVTHPTTTDTSNTSTTTDASSTSTAGGGNTGSVTTEAGTLTKIITITNTITEIPKTDTKDVKRQYEHVDVISNWSDIPSNISGAIFQDVVEYLQLSGLVTGYYGLDLAKKTYSSSAFVPADGSLMALANSDDLRSIVVNLIKTTTVDALKSDLKFSEDDLLSIENQLANTKGLVASIEDLRKTTTDLQTQLTQLLTETETIHKTLQEKPTFTESEKRDNTDIVTVTMDMNADLSKLVAASQTLMTNTKSNQAVSESIEGSIKKLSEDVATLEKDGESLSARVAELKAIMTGQYGSNEAFLQKFSTVLGNTKTGNVKNEAVYEYLSNPVDATKVGQVLSVASSTPQEATRQDERSGLLIILISYLTSLVIAYLMQHADKEALQKHLQLSERLSWRNARGPMIYLTLVASLSGLLIAFVAGFKLAFTVSQLTPFILLVILMLLTMTYGVNLLMEKLRSLGFLLSVTLLMLYIITATQLFDAYYVNSTQLLANLSPLTYMENVIRSFINQQTSLVVPISVLIIIVTGLGVLNSYFYRRIKE